MVATDAVAMRGGARAGEEPEGPERTYAERSGTINTHVTMTTDDLHVTFDLLMYCRHELALLLIIIIIYFVIIILLYYLYYLYYHIINILY